MKLLQALMLACLGLQAAAILSEQERHHHHKKHHKKQKHGKLRGKATKLSKEQLEELRSTYTVLRFGSEYCDGPYHAVELKLNETKAVQLAHKKQKETLCGRLTKDEHNNTIALSSCPGSGEQCPDTCDACHQGNFMHFPMEECSKGWLVLQGPAPNECHKVHDNKNLCKGLNTNDLGLVQGCAIPKVPVSQLSTKQKHKKGRKGSRKGKHHKKHHKKHHGKKKHHEDDAEQDA